MCILAAYPDVEIHDVNDTWDFVLLASDGIWDVLTNDDVVKLCLKKMEKGIPPEQICEEIMTECLSPDLLMTGTDNMTIVLICFLHNKPYEDFCKRAAEYCQRYFPDDEKYQSIDSQSPTKGECGNAEHPAAVISQNDDEAEDSSYNSDDEPAKMNDQNGDGDSNKKDTENVNTNKALENGQSDGKTGDDVDPTQESKKFKEEDDDNDASDLK